LNVKIPKNKIPVLSSWISFRKLLLLWHSCCVAWSVYCGSWYDRVGFYATLFLV